MARETVPKLINTRQAAFDVVLALVITFAIASILFALAPSPQAPARLAELKTLGVAHLENGDYAQSERAFVEIAAALPDEPLGFRNLTVSRLLAFKAAPAAERPAALERAREALRRLRSVAPGDPATERLAARLAAAAGENREAVSALARAAALAPEDAGLWYELYLLAESAAEGALQARARAALARAFDLEPRNLSVLVDRLGVQSEHRDPDIARTLEHAREVLSPFVDGIRGHTQVDLDDLLAQALAAAGSADEAGWRTVQTNARIIANVLRPEVATRLDRKRLVPHDLEYTLARFRHPSLAGNGPGESPSIPVSLDLPPAARQFPAMSGVGAAILADFDLDGRVELLVGRGAELAIYRDDGERWEPIVNLDLPLEVNGLIAADLDRDAEENAHTANGCGSADLDLIAFGAEGILVLENRLDSATGARTLEPRPQGAGFVALREVQGAAVADLEHDGDLDLVVSSAAGVSLWANLGDFTFRDTSDGSALPPEEIAPSGFIPVDWNRTVDVDLLIAGGSGAGAGYLENLRHGRFRWRDYGAGLEALRGSEALALGDFDANGSWDLVGGGPHGLVSVLTRTAERGRVATLSSAAISQRRTRGLVTWDYDNDGYLDLLAWGEDGFDVRRGRPGGAFSSIEGLFASEPVGVERAEAADIDADGDLDVMVLAGGLVRWYRNEGGNANHWIDIALSGQRTPDQKDERVNLHGIGSLLEVAAGTLHQSRVVAGTRTHFGLGDAARADAARVLWTNGIPQVEIEPAAERPICEVQELKGSCPYLYTWTGERFEFMTDLLWAAPIGLQVAEHVLAPAREWEYLKIPGERLVALEREYRLRITEELWEAAYFDRVSLIAVDHPADVDVYTNEKVAPAELARFRVHTVRKPRAPVAARDQRGRDVLALVADRDGRYLRAFERRIVQGLVDPHFLELDLGPLPSGQAITLFLTGWVRPTDTSLNIALSQNPALAAPRPPALWVPDRQGAWREVRPYIGFPGGKTKTIAIDLSDAFLTGDHRVRIATEMEIYWDAAFFTVSEAPAEIRLTELELLGADLRYRGFSTRVERPGNAPETFDYARVSSAPKWPPMDGRFTRFGDVAALLRDADDRLVVMGAGDEVALRFAVPPDPPPPGWRRDFILHSIGWDKDADLNTVYGDTTEPLPYRGMPGYPYPGASEPERSDYLESYQTRALPFRAALD